MIVERLTTGPKMTLAYMSVKQDAEGIRIPPQPVDIAQDICICRCVHEMLVFGDTAVGAPNHQKDQTSAIFQKLITADTITMELWKNGVKVADLNDDTYGTFFDFGDFSGQPFYTGYLLDWTLVLDALGAGTYNIVAQTNILTVETQIPGQVFRLLPYQDLFANGTVRLDFTLNRNNQRSFFDFTDLNWFQSLRIQGKFITDIPEFEVTNYEDRDRNQEPIKAQTNPFYILETNFFPAILGKYLVNEGIHADSIICTDYNALNFENILELSLFPSSIEDFKPSYNGPTGLYRIKFSETANNIITQF